MDQFSGWDSSISTRRRTRGLEKPPKLKRAPKLQEQGGVFTWDDAAFADAEKSSLCSQPFGGTTCDEQATNTVQPFWWTGKARVWETNNKVINLIEHYQSLRESSPKSFHHIFLHLRSRGRQGFVDVSDYKGGCGTSPVRLLTDQYIDDIVDRNHGNQPCMFLYQWYR